MSIPARLLMNTVRIYKWGQEFNDANEPIETYTPDASFAASVQDGPATELNMPDMDGPVLVDATIFANYRTDIEHRDQLWQTDVDPVRKYLVIFVDDAAGRHHHLEVRCERIQPIGEASS